MGGNILAAPRGPWAASCLPRPAPGQSWKPPAQSVWLGGRWWVGNEVPLQDSPPGPSPCLWGEAGGWAQLQAENSNIYKTFVLRLFWGSISWGNVNTPSPPTPDHQWWGESTGNPVSFLKGVWRSVPGLPGAPSKKPGWCDRGKARGRQLPLGAWPSCFPRLLAPSRLATRPQATDP